MAAWEEASLLALSVPAGRCQLLASRRGPARPASGSPVPPAAAPAAIGLHWCLFSLAGSGAFRCLLLLAGAARPALDAMPSAACCRRARALPAAFRRPPPRPALPGSVLRCWAGRCIRLFIFFAPCCSVSNGGFGLWEFRRKEESVSVVRSVVRSALFISSKVGEGRLRANSRVV